MNNGIFAIQQRIRNLDIELEMTRRGQMHCAGQEDERTRRITELVDKRKDYQIEEAKLLDQYERDKIKISETNSKPIKPVTETNKNRFLLGHKRPFIDDLGVYHIGIKKIDINNINDTKKKKEEFESYHIIDGGHANKSGKFYVALRIILVFIDAFSSNKDNIERKIKEDSLEGLIKKHYKTIRKYDKRMKECISTKGINSFANIFLDWAKTNLEIIKQNDEYIMKLKL